MLVVVTGVSTGIGKAIAERCIASGDEVIGVGRNNVLQAPNYNFISCDLSDAQQIERLSFPFSEHDKIVLINNAGVIGEIKRVSALSPSTLEEVVKVNALAPMLLSQLFCRSITDQELTIINLSSGAGKRPIASWAAYCASKAALDLFSQTLQLEEEERKSKVRVYSVAPGVVDTQMQAAIRSSKDHDFSLRQQFVDYHKQHQLISPETVADQIIKLIHLRPTLSVVFSLKDV